MELNIVPECFVDTKVAEIVGQAKTPNHQHGCGNVARVMQKSPNKVLLGIIDEDLHKGPPAKYFLEFNIICSENNLILKRHYRYKQYLILVQPEMEEWLLTDAQISGIDPTDEKYSLPEGLKGLKATTKIRGIDNNDGFYRFIKALQRANAPSITTLKNWLTLFKENRLDELSKLP